MATTTAGFADYAVENARHRRIAHSLIAFGVIVWIALLVVTVVVNQVLVAIPAYAVLVLALRRAIAHLDQAYSPY